jgi:hypothetical protein
MMSLPVVVVPGPATIAAPSGQDSYLDRRNTSSAVWEDFERFLDARCVIPNRDRVGEE